MITFSETLQIFNDKSLTKKEKYYSYFKSNFKLLIYSNAYSGYYGRIYCKAGQYAEDLKYFIYSHHYAKSTYDAAKYLNEQTGECSFVLYSSDARLQTEFKEILDGFTQNTNEVNRVAKRRSTSLQEILQSRYYYLLFCIINEIKLLLNISFEQASKLIDEKGNLLLEASRNQKTLSSKQIKDTQAKLKDAQKQLDEFIASDLDFKFSKSSELYNWESFHVGCIYRAMLKDLGKEETENLLKKMCTEIDFSYETLITLHFYTSPY